MMTKEQEIQRINQLMKEKLNAENVHRLYVAAVVFWETQSVVEWETSGNLINPEE